MYAVLTYIQQVISGLGYEPFIQRQMKKKMRTFLLKKDNDNAKDNDNENRTRTFLLKKDNENEEVSAKEI